MWELKKNYPREEDAMERKTQQNMYYSVKQQKHDTE